MHPYAVDSDERRNWYVALFCVSVALAWALNRLLTWIDVDVPWWIDAPSVFGFLGLLYELFDHWVWRWGFLRKLRLVRMPDLNGRWTGSVESGVAEYAGQRHEATLVIQQTFSRICVIFETAKSRSASRAAWIITNPEVALAYEYANEPRALAEATMQAHTGTARYRLEEDGREARLDGEYYSGRGRQGFGSAEFTRTA